MAENPKPELPGTARLIDVVAKLRSKDGCPWDRKQTLSSLRPYLIEEAYELLDALDAEDPERHKEEMGDVLLQLALQSRIREEQGAFTLDDVAAALSEKLVRRHPHVFGDVEARTPEEVVQHWEAIKAEERKGSGHGIFESLPVDLPALQKAQRVQSRAARAGFDWEEVGGALAKVDEELAELHEAIGDKREDRVVEELGDLLFSVVNVSRFFKVSAEDALRSTIRKFMHRFDQVEQRVIAENRTLADCSLEELDRHWNAVKDAEC